MKLICDGLDLSDAINKVSRALPQKAVNPILEGIKITAKNNQVTLFGADAEISIQKTIKAEITEEGEILVPGKFLGEYVRKLTNQQIELFNNEKNQLRIKYGDNEGFIQLLDKTDYPTDFKYQALLCLTYFRHAVTELCRTLSETGDAAAKLHEKYESDCTAVFSEIRSGKYDRLYASAGFDPASHNEITVSISILRPDLFLPLAHDNSMCLFAGICHTDTLIRAFDEDSIDLDRFFDHFGNEIRRMILEALAEHGEMTASDLSRSTGIPVTTVLRHIDALTEDYLLSVSRRKGLQIFYTLNREYIGKARRKADRYFMKLSGNEE